MGPMEVVKAPLCVPWLWDLLVEPSFWVAVNFLTLTREGRAKTADAYIKHNEEHAVIELELKRGTQNLVIRRDLYKGRPHQWKINGRNANQNAVLQKVRELNIQVDNLCQFLPQDRVCSFAQLSPPELLQETEKAVGGDGMLEKHLKLIQLKKAQLGSGKSVEVCHKSWRALSHL